MSRRNRFPREQRGGSGWVIVVLIALGLAALALLVIGLLMSAGAAR